MSRDDTAVFWGRFAFFITDSNKMMTLAIRNIIIDAGNMKSEVIIWR